MQVSFCFFLVTYIRAEQEMISLLYTVRITWRIVLTVAMVETGQQEEFLRILYKALRTFASST